MSDPSYLWQYVDQTISLISGVDLSTMWPGSGHLGLHCSPFCPPVGVLLSRVYPLFVQELGLIRFAQSLRSTSSPSIQSLFQSLSGNDVPIYAAGSVKHSAGPISTGQLYPWVVAARWETLVSPSLAVRTAYRPIRIHTNIKPCVRGEECRAIPQDCQAPVSPSPQFVRQFGGV